MNKLIAYQFASGVVARISEGLVKKGVHRYGTLKQCSGRFKVPVDRLKSILAPYLDGEEATRWILFLPEDGKLVPYFQQSEVRTLLHRHNIYTVKNYKRRRKNRWEVSETKGLKPINGKDLRVDINNVPFYRPAYWITILGLPKGSMSHFVDELENNPEYKDHFKRFDPLSYNVGAKRKLRETRFLFFDKVVAQAIVDRSDKLHTNNCTFANPEDKSHFRTAFQWKNELYVSTDKNISIAVGNRFYDYLKGTDGFIAEEEGVQFRVYPRETALQALARAIQDTKMSK